ncbi:hypothetical protein [Bradyrhizobium shewense]|uniref:hypothetical protein n=1 Tax=Bradyrhizobium shewense TaxID=1761772 RepID=UPI00101AED4F|nr:hypothetical protein [Bradyrhizobium shewense]
MKRRRRKVTEPDWSLIARELKRKHVTLQVLWDGHIAEHPDGYRYGRFCDFFRNWGGRLPLVMRHHHAGAMPGIDPVSAVTFRSPLDDPRRCSCIPNTLAHTGVDALAIPIWRARMGRITKVRDGETRKALFEAAHVVFTASDPVISDEGY